MPNQTPEQRARDIIDRQLKACGWIVQTKNKINLNAGVGIAVTEYQSEVGPADYILFVNKKPLGVIEAKRPEEGVHLVAHEQQTDDYATAKLKHLNNEPLVYRYESTGEITRFTDYTDPKPRSREIFSFHRPETFLDWQKKGKSLRARLLEIPVLPIEHLRECQIRAINNLEDSFKATRPRALIQMATGSGKTFTAITSVYRLLKFAGAKRILFLVDTKNLGEQAEQEFLAYQPNDDNRSFSELYAVQRLKSNFIPTDTHVCIGTIQRLYSILKGTELDESAEVENPNERKFQPKEPLPVVYNEKIPIEFFDFIVIDECHRSIYNLWKQVLDYFDGFLIGLTATPDNRTFGFFNQNIVSEYTHEEAVADGVNVGSDIFTIETDITTKGSIVWKGQFVDKRERLTRKKRWEEADEDVVYTSRELDNNVVNPNQIRLIIKTFKEQLPLIFAERFDANGQFEVPKTLVFAKSDSHADDIIQIIREEFNEENKFCQKITYNADDPKSVLSQFRNAYYPRIAVTVDMIATGTDVRPLECLLFMRDVASRNYFEQMKGRGTRVITLDELKKVSPSAKFTKDHYVIVDAIGVTKSLKTDSRPLEKKPTTPLKELLGAVAVGARDEDLFSSLANRLIRLNRQITEKERALFAQKAHGKTPSQVAKELLSAYHPDTIDNVKLTIENEMPNASPADKDSTFSIQHSALIEEAAKVFTGDLNTYIENVRKIHEQIIDTTNPDILISAGWNAANSAKSEELITSFRNWIETHKNEIVALQIFYGQPYRRRELTYSIFAELLETIKVDAPTLAPLHIWRAYEQLGKVTGQPKNELVALVSLIRNISGIDSALTPYDKTVDKNFQEWVFKKQAGTLKFTEEQMTWLRMIKEYIAMSFHIEKDDFELAPFNAAGGLGKMWQLFGEQMEPIINELNETLVA